MSEALLRWCVDELHHRFGLEVCEDIVQYILSINNEEEIVEYVGDMLQSTDCLEGKKNKFKNDLVTRWQQSQQIPLESTGLSPRMDSPTEILDMTKDSQKKSKRKGRKKQEVMPINQAEPAPEVVKTPIDLMKAQENSGASSQKKKSKFVSLYNKEGQDRLAVLLPGRHPCDCLAQKHGLVNNCMSCGRIVCEQEGLGPCLFCGNLVGTKEEMEILQRDSNKSQKLRKKLMGERVHVDGRERERLPYQEEKMKAGLEKALQHKDKLLEYDRNSVRRTQVLDDESDYFATDSNQWLSPKEREALRKKEEELRELRHASRKDRKITIDFAGRQVLEENENLNQFYSKFDETVAALNTGSLVRPQADGMPAPHLRELVNPNIVQSAPQWVDVTSGDGPRRPKGKSKEGDGRPEHTRLRLQDRALQEIADGGMCLSMHQPWASLLVRGIKRVEGRTWYTSHRGRLWIAAAAKQPTPQEVAEVENMYRQLYKTDPGFPKEYPTGCLLGCVNVTDCLSQEQYREQFPHTCEESASPFVFICTSPRELLVKFPMKGKHKIWKLESHYHKCAKKGLMAAM